MFVPKIFDCHDIAYIVDIFNRQGSIFQKSHVPETNLELCKSSCFVTWIFQSKPMKMSCFPPAVKLRDRKDVLSRQYDTVSSGTGGRHPHIKPVKNKSVSQEPPVALTCVI